MPTITPEYIQSADAHNADRGFIDWAALSVVEKKAALLRACDYIASHYSAMRSPLQADEERVRDQGVFRIARALAKVTEPERKSAPLLKKTTEMGALKKTVEYGSDDVDAFPDVTSLYAPLMRKQTLSTVFSWQRSV